MRLMANQTKHGWIKGVNKSMKSRLKENDIEMYSTHNEAKPVFAGRFIRSLKIKMYKYITPVSKNVYIDKLDDTVNKYKSTCHSTIKMRAVDVKSSTYIDFNKENNKKDPNFKVSDHVRLSKYKNIFVKG